MIYQRFYGLFSLCLGTRLWRQRCLLVERWGVTDFFDEEVMVEQIWVLVLKVGKCQLVLVLFGTELGLE